MRPHPTLSYPPKDGSVSKADQERDSTKHMDHLLRQFNFSEGEIIVYKALLKSGGAKVSHIADLTGLKRTSCQEYIQSLVQKGFINSSKIGNKYFYQTEDPDKFRQIVNERQYIVDRLIPMLKQKPTHEEWQVREVKIEEVKRKIFQAKKKQQSTTQFGNASVGGAVIGGTSTLLFSTNKEISAIEIISKTISNFHQDILKVTSS